MLDKKIRVRFAPSPTGPLHIGGVRTALYNYLFAKKNNGSFILRIEDTDQNRFVEGAEEYIIESLKWCGVKFDEGIGIGGEYGPYKQSERKEIYKKYSDQLIEKGFAYFAFDTPEELETARKKLEEEKANNTGYSPHSRMNMTNSLSLSNTETTKRIDAGIPYVVRFKMPENEEIILQDRIRGEITVNSSTLDDKVLFKSDGMPTYHLANIVDDHLMEISHVIRGEEWLPSLPLHIMLYRSLNWEAPEFAHLPLLLKPNGNGKLSKRDGDKFGFPVFPIRWPLDISKEEIASGYRESGYFPDAFLNMLALLGWNPGDDKEILNTEELITDFSLEKVSKAGAKFDPEKAKWFNHQYLLKADNETLSEKFLLFLSDKNIICEKTRAEQIVILVKERANFIADIYDQAHFFFHAPKEYNPKVVKKKWKEHTPALLNGLKEEWNNTDDFTAENLHTILSTYIEKKEVGFGQIMNPLRLSIVGSDKGPDLLKTIEILGKKESIRRIETALNTIR